MFAMNLNAFNTIEVSDRDNSGPYTIFIMIFERYIDIRGRFTNFKVTFFVLAYIFVCTAGTCGFVIRHFFSFQKQIGDRVSDLLKLYNARFPTLRNVEFKHRVMIAYIIILPSN